VFGFKTLYIQNQAERIGPLERGVTKLVDTLKNQKRLLGAILQRELGTLKGGGWRCKRVEGTEGIEREG